MSDLLTVEEAAARLRCSRRRVFELLADGTLSRGPKFGKRTVVTAASVTAALQAPEAPAVPEAPRAPAKPAAPRSLVADFEALQERQRAAWKKPRRSRKAA